MNTRYFDTCNSLDEASKLYKALAIKNHPDHGGDLRTMQDINGQYAEFCASFTNRSERARQQKAHSQGRKTAADYHDIDGVTEELRRRIEWALNNLPADVMVELCGLWVWLTGNTKPVKEDIKQAGLGFTFSGSKQAWYYAGVPSFNKKRMNLDEIRGLHGSTTFARKQQEERESLPAYV